MKFLVVLALIAMALAEPEADPALVYTTNTLPLTTSALHPPLVYNTQALQKHLVYTTTGVHHPLVYNSAVQTPLVFPSYGKREAEAEPEAEAEADPALIYTTYGYGVPAYRTYSAYPYTYGARTFTYGAYPYTHYAYGKRSAEAEPKADAEADPALLYSTGLVNPVTYTHAVPAVHTYAAVPAVQQVATPVVNTVYNAVKVAQPVVQQQVYSHLAQPLVYANP